MEETDDAMRTYLQASFGMLRTRGEWRIYRMDIPPLHIDASVAFPRLPKSNSLEDVVQRLTEDIELMARFHVSWGMLRQIKSLGYFPKHNVSRDERGRVILTATQRLSDFAAADDDPADTWRLLTGTQERRPVFSARTNHQRFGRWPKVNKDTR